MHNYEEITNELISLANIPVSDVFYYQDSPLKEIYDGYFQFCQENLSSHNVEFNIQPARFYFRALLEVNANAGRSNGYSIIGVNMATIHHQHKIFDESDKLFKTDQYLKLTYESFLSCLDKPIGIIMFQFTSLFTYYHELAHLIQKSPLLNEGLSEKYSENNSLEYSLDKHLLEYDADLNSAHLTCFHLIEYWQGFDLKNQTQSNFEKLLSIGIASIFSYLMLFFTNEGDIYYKKGSHPHPLIRTTYILDEIIRIVGVNVPTEWKINRKEIINNGLQISDIILNKDLSAKFGKYLNEESSQIESFITELIQLTNNLDFLVKNRVT